MHPKWRIKILLIGQRKKSYLWNIYHLKVNLVSFLENLIGSEGFKLLSKTKMNNLISINIYKTSLVDDESIDSILKLNLSKL